jgi:hypothetical protein
VKLASRVSVLSFRRVIARPIGHVIGEPTRTIAPTRDRQLRRRTGRPPNRRFTVIRAFVPMDNSTACATATSQERPLLRNLAGAGEGAAGGSPPRPLCIRPVRDGDRPNAVSRALAAGAGDQADAGASEFTRAIESRPARVLRASGHAVPRSGSRAPLRERRRDAGGSRAAADGEAGVRPVQPPHRARAAAPGPDRRGSGTATVSDDRRNLRRDPLNGRPGHRRRPSEHVHGCTAAARGVAVPADGAPREGLGYLAGA